MPSTQYKVWNYCLLTIIISFTNFCVVLLLISKGKKTISEGAYLICFHSLKFWNFEILLPALIVKSDGEYLKTIWKSFLLLPSSFSWFFCSSCFSSFSCFSDIGYLYVAKVHWRSLCRWGWTWTNRCSYLSLMSV